MEKVRGNEPSRQAGNASTTQRGQSSCFEAPNLFRRTLPVRAPFRIEHRIQNSEHKKAQRPQEHLDRLVDASIGAQRAGYPLGRLLCALHEDRDGLGLREKMMVVAVSWRLAGEQPRRQKVAGGHGITSLKRANDLAESSPTRRHSTPMCPWD